MNAQLKDAPLRDTSAKLMVLLGDHVVVPYQYHQDTEAQLRHLTACVVTSDRAKNEAEQKLADLILEGIEYPERIAALERERDAYKAQADRLTLELNTPETKNFASGLFREAAHQRQKWGTDSDAHKKPEDWLFLIGYLAGKACRYFAMADTLAGVASQMPEAGGERAYTNNKAREAHEKGVHHMITTAAACANWHLNVTGADTRMRAGKPIEFQAEEEPEPAPLYAPLAHPQAMPAAPAMDLEINF